MSQSRSYGLDPRTFFDECSSIDAESIDPQRSSNGNFRDAVERSNDMMEVTWNARLENPRAWIHNSLRWRLLHLTINDFVEAAELSGRTIVKTLEDPKVENDLRLHDSAHLSIAYMDRINGSLGKRIQRIMQEGRRRLLESLTAPYTLQTERLMLSERIIAGPDAFNERTSNATQRIRGLIVNERIVPFGELTNMMRGLHFLDTRKMASNNPNTWAEPHIQSAFASYVADHVARGVPEPIAQLMAMIEFSGHKCTTDDLKKLGMSNETSSALTNKRMPQLEKLEALKRTFYASIGRDCTNRLFASWKNVSEQFDRKQSFSKRMRKAIGIRNIEPADLVRVFEMDPSEVIPHEVIRIALERGPSKRMPLIALTHILARNPEEQARHEKQARKELQVRQSASRVKASHRLPAEMQLCGVGIDDLDFNDAEKDEFKKIRSGKPSSLRERDMLSHIHSIGIEKNVMPPLQRWIASQEPSSIARFFELIAMRTPYEIRKLVKASHTSEATIGAYRRNELLPSHVALRTFADAAKVKLPAHVEISCLLQAADLRAAKNIQPLGRAANALIERTHDHRKAFCREREIGSCNQTFGLYLKEASTKGKTHSRFVRELSEKAESADAGAMSEYVHALSRSDSEKTALETWITKMLHEGRQEYIDGFIALQTSLRSSEEENHNDNITQRLQGLQERNFRLHRWKYGQKNPQTSETEDLSSPQEKLALQTLLLIPGVTTESVLAVSLKETKTEVVKHTQRVAKLTGMNRTNEKLVAIVEQLLSGDRSMHHVFYGDPSKIGSEYRVEVMGKRYELGFANVYLDEDNKEMMVQ